MSHEWANRLLALLADPELTPGALRRQFEDAKSALAVAQEKVEKLERLLVARAERNASSVEHLMSMREDPVVLVRPYGSPRVFHSVAAPCGWAAEAESYDRLLLGEAIERGLQPCRSCGGSVPGLGAPNSRRSADRSADIA